MLRLKEAISMHHAKTGNRLTYQDIGKQLWPETDVETAGIRFSYLCTGRTKRITQDDVLKICELTGVTPNFIFGYEESK